VCCSATQGWLGFPWPPKRGWAKRCSTLPWPLSGWALQFLFFLLTRRSPRGGSGCQGCAAERSTTGATEERKAPGLDAGASAAYLALPSSRKNRSEQTQARGAAPALRPPARPPWPWEAFHGVPIAAHSPARKRPLERQPVSVWQGFGGAQPPGWTPAHARLHQAHACAFRSGSDPRSPLMRGMGVTGPSGPGRAQRRRCLPCAPPGGDAVRQGAAAVGARCRADGGREYRLVAQPVCGVSAAAAPH
jgi:hypothetical protein